MSPINIANIYAILGNSSSLVPLGIKDVSNIAGMTAGSCITGKGVEGKDRFIDEMGTSIIWLLGIPIFHKIIDKTIYKIAKFNPNIDVRLLKNPEIFEKAKQYANPKLQKDFEKIKQNQKLFKGLALGKFALSTILTLVSYFALTKFRHKHTEKNVIEEIKREENNKKTKGEPDKKEKSSVNFKGINKKQQKKINFGMNMGAALSQFMFDPVKNTMLIDAGITTERLTESRNPQDFFGYVIKEGGFLAFMYFADKAIKKYLENKAAETGRPINLDIRVLQDKDFQEAIINGKIKEEHLEKLSPAIDDYKSNIAQKSDTKETKITKAKNRTNLESTIYESLFEKKQQDNLVIKMAKKSDIIGTINEKTFFKKITGFFKGEKIQKELQEIDPQKYIDIEKIVEHKAGIENLYNKFLESGKKADFFDEILKYKKASIRISIGASIVALGILVPGAMIAARFLNKDNKEFRVKREIHEKWKREHHIDETNIQKPFQH